MLGGDLAEKYQISVILLEILILQKPKNAIFWDLGPK